MKKFLPCAVVLALALCGAMPASAQQSPTNVVLTVNDQQVYAWEIGLEVPRIQQEMIRQGMKPEQEMVIQAAMQRVVDSKLLAQEAKRLKMQPNDQRVKETMAQIEEQAGGRAKLDEALAQRGMTYEMLAASVAESDLVQVFIETTIDPGVAVSPEEVAAYYSEHPEMFQRPEQVHARHILMPTGADATEATRAEALAKAQAARKRALAGEDFATLAIEVSEGPSAPKGGDLGFLARQQMVAPFADVAFALEVGGISEVVETQFGYHVIKVDEKRPAATMTLDEVREPLTEMLRQNQGGEATTKVLDQLAEKAKITQVGLGSAEPGAAASGE